jgi:hypothetical protein
MVRQEARKEKAKGGTEIQVEYEESALIALLFLHPESVLE